MRLSWKREILALALLVAMAFIAIHYYSILPDRIPDRLNAHGTPVGWTGKTDFFLRWGVFLVIPYVLFTFLPILDPIRHKLERKSKVLLLIRDVLLVTFAVLFVVSIATTAGGKFGVNWLGVAIGISFVVYGNYLPKIPQNLSVGMKTAWTLSSEIVWKKTQVFAGWLIAATGLAFIVFSFTGLNISIPVLAVIPVMAVIRIYSYLAYKKASAASVERT